MEPSRVSILPHKEYSHAIHGAGMATIPYPIHFPIIAQKINKMKSMNKLQKTFSLFSIGLLLAVTFSFTTSNYFEVSRNLDIFATLFKEINLKYVDETDPGKLMQAAIKAMLEELDPYTNFISEEDIEDYRFLTTGQYGGIGSGIRKIGDYIVITEPYEGFPAQKSGIIAGDIITDVDGKSIKGRSIEEVSTMLKGQQGTRVSVTLLRDGKEMVFDVERAEVKIDNIPWYGMLENNIAYIRLSGFTENAGNELKKHFEELKEAHKPAGLIIDLRGNGGGLLKEAVNICNLFIKKGQEVVSTKGRIQGGSRTHFTINQPIDLDIPIVTLVNRGSASASEIVSGAFQDLDRGVVIGQRTFGKGLVQNVFPLTYNAQVKITIAKYYIPSGRCIQAVDYAHRNIDGSIDKIPDSLMTAFTTKNGRIVYDGGGIVPDIEMPERDFGQITISLLTENIIFDYANAFRRNNSEIPEPEKFQITDAIYNEFVAFVNSKDFDYQTNSELMMEELKKITTEEKYFENIQNEYEKLFDKLKHNKASDLQTFRPEISLLLKDEIIARYYYQKGRIRASLSEDPEIAKAIELLSKPEKYAAIVKGQKK